MNKLAIVTTGGTIGAVLKNGAVSIDKDVGDLYSKIMSVCRSLDCDFEVFPAIDKISEDMTPYDWGLIIKEIQKVVDSGYKNIVVTHGTDTIAYTSTVLSMFFAGSGIRICVTGSFYPQNHPDSDVRINLEAAVNIALDPKTPEGVFVSFRKDPDECGIYSGFSIKPMEFDANTFRSIYGCELGEYSTTGGVSFYRNPPAGLVLEGEKPDPAALLEASREFLMLNLYPGMEFTRLIKITNDYDAVIIPLYHSGTAPFSDGKGSLVDFIARAESKVFLATYPSRYVGNPYESTLRLVDVGGIVIKDLLPHHLYSCLVCGKAQGRSLADLIHVLEPWIAVLKAGGAPKSQVFVSH